MGRRERRARHRERAVLSGEMSGAAGGQDAFPIESSLFMLLEAPEDPERRAGLSAAIAAGRIPWPPFLSDGAAPYFFDCIRKAGLEAALPADVCETFNLSLLEQTGRNIVMLRELDAVLDALNSRGITPVLLKGSALLNEIYKHPGHRRLADLDLLILKNEMATAAEALSQIGYSLAGGRGHHTNFAAVREFPVLLELHTALFNPDNPFQRFAFPLDAGEFASRAAPLDINGRRALSFRAGDQFIYLACHAAKERYGQPQAYC